MFAVVALIEYYARVKFRRNQTLSEQNVLDCDNSTSNSGCVGGSIKISENKKISI